MTMPRFLFAAAGALAAGLCSANVPGGGDGKGPDVTLKDEGGHYVLDNGIVAIRINKTNARSTSSATRA